jgi:hypothetical protein
MPPTETVSSVSSIDTQPPPRRLLQVLSARFDAEALVAPSPDPSLKEQTHPQLHDQLLHWCHAGAGSGAVPWFAPRRWPLLPTPLAVAVLSGPDTHALLAWATHFAWVLDGSQQLQAAQRSSGRLGAVALKLRVKANDASWWRKRRSTDPWDCGLLPGTPAAQARLQHFAPRRPTLVLVHAVPAAVLQAALLQLQARQAAFVRPVRVLVLGEAILGELTPQLLGGLPGGLPGGLAFTRFDLS